LPNRQSLSSLLPGQKAISIKAKLTASFALLALNHCLSPTLAAKAEEQPSSSNSSSSTAESQHLGQNRSLQQNSLDLDRALNQAFNEANNFFQARHYAGTLKSLEKSLALFNATSLTGEERYKLSRLFLLKANTQRIIRLYQDALVSFDNCLKLDPKCVDALCFKGFSLCRLNRKEEAMQSLVRAYSLLSEPAAKQEGSTHGLPANDTDTDANSNININRPGDKTQDSSDKTQSPDSRSPGQEETTTISEANTNAQTENAQAAGKLPESYQVKLKALMSEALKELRGECKENLTKADDLIKPITAIVPGDHFILYGTISQPTLKRYAALAEAFYHFIDSTLFRLEGDYPAGVFLFRDKYEARKFLQQRLNFQKHVLGAFLSERNLIVCYQDDDIGVFLHELSHKFFFSIKNLEYWAEEGIPASFEKAYGYYQRDNTTASDTLFLRYGYPELPEFKFDPRLFLQSIPGLRSHFANPPKPPALSAIVKLSPHTNADYQTLQRFIACFLIDNKLLPQYLALTVSKNKKGYSSYVEAAFNQSFAKLDKRFEIWVSPYYKRGSKERNYINSLPASEIFETKIQYDKIYSH
jgi:tetratricopeptide (TPR) repeat protein